MSRKPTARETKNQSVNRAEVIRRNDTVADITVGLYDHDEAVKYYVDNVIKLQVVDSNKELVKVPLMYGNPERWKSVQKSSFYRDKEGKIQIPLMMYRRTGFEKERNLTRNLDANSPQLHQYLQNSYSQINKYDNFSRLVGREPIKELHQVVVPDYITINYEFIVWTEFMGQMNKIIEALNYAEGAYWGDKDRWQFLSQIDNFGSFVEVADDRDRSVRTTFDLTLRGYIVPENIQKAATEQSQKVFTKGVVQFGENVVDKL